MNKHVAPLVSVKVSWIKATEERGVYVETLMDHWENKQLIESCREDELAAFRYSALLH